MIIKDNYLEPYYIDYSRQNITIRKLTFVKEGANKGKEVHRDIAYHSNMNMAIKTIIDYKIGDNTSILSLKEFIIAYKEIVKKLEGILL